MKRAMRKTFLANENDYHGEFHMAIKEQITDI